MGLVGCLDRKESGVQQSALRGFFYKKTELVLLAEFVAIVVFVHVPYPVIKVDGLWNTLSTFTNLNISHPNP